jgi:hypothetical protein
MPINDRLVRHAVLVVQDFEDVWEGLEQPSIGIAVDLDGVDQGHLGLGAVGECFEEGGVGLEFS